MTEHLELIDRARNVVQQWLGRQLTLRFQPADDGMQLAIRPRGGRQDRVFNVIVMDMVNDAEVAKLIRGWPPAGQALLIAPYINAAQGNKLKDKGIPFIDGAGNAYLADAGIFVLIVGNPPPPDLPKPIKAPRLFNATGLKVLFVLLARPEYLEFTYRDIARAAGVALGTVGWVMYDLKRLGYLIDQGKRDKRLRRQTNLINEWARAYALQLKPRQPIRRFRAENAGWWKNFDLRTFAALWGGDVAAEHLTAYLKPAEIMVYAKKENQGPLLQKLRARADPHGNVILIEPFWDFPVPETKLDTVPPLLVYADLMATGDDRAIETAEIIRERYLVRPDDEN